MLFSCCSAVAARAQLIFVDSFFVHVLYECVSVCENVCVCATASIFLCIPFFFVGRRAAALTLALDVVSCFLGPPAE